ncbi:LCCL domain-containing protein [Sphingosinicella rhizophila]|uniref:LCCL domain-containing protein n=1 Tax=Sphingosinicella rhizophila TaxID=3050082 RepID=A0ABU3QAY2_9SPHN|nr:LCCL domain-containing protein [Sphingosinicella sp. GR2756]MDT9600570.1 LCCL domain-containing protein [Sphingosinicella sp. GR2756]
MTCRRRNMARITLFVPLIFPAAAIAQPGLSRPVYVAVSVPPVPARLCSETEKNEVVRRFAQESAKAFGNRVEADEYAMRLSQEYVRLTQAGRGIQPELQEARNAAAVEVRERARLADEALARLEAVAALKVADCGSGGDAAVAAASPPVDPALVAAAGQVPTAASSPAERRRAAEALLARIAPLQVESADARRISQGLKLLLDRDQILQDAGLEAAIAAIEQAAAGPGRKRAWQALGAEVLDRARHFAAMMAAGDYDAEDAARLLNMTKYAAQLLDDIRKPGGALTGDNAGKVTQFLAAAYGAAAVYHGTEQGDARVIMDGVRDLFSMSPILASTVWTAVDVPGEVAGAMVNVSKKGMDQASEAMDEITAAMAGDPNAVGRAIAISRQLEQTLSGASYGKAMREAITSRIIDRIPGLRAVVAWWAADGHTPVAAARPVSMKVVSGFPWHWSASHPTVNDRDIFACGPSRYRSTVGVDGTDIYADSSPLCVAAVHAGAIDWRGGRFRVRFMASDGSPLVASLRHGIQSGSYSGWRRRFMVEPVR